MQGGAVWQGSTGWAFLKMFLSHLAIQTKGGLLEQLLK
jgi:hypothetical protein